MFEVSVIVPVKNEEATIEALLAGLLAQTHLPAEIVITDGGSTDRTKELIREWQRKSPVPVHLIETAQALPGRGRNLAIRQARYDWVACIDAGIVPARDWLKRLVETAAQNPQARMIFGRCAAADRGYFTQSAAIVYMPPPARRAPFIVSALLHRAAWAAAGEFREDLRSGEDLLFFKGLEKARVICAWSLEAWVTWELQPSAASTYRRFAVYSQNGMRAGLGAEWQLSVTRFYVLLAVLIALGFFSAWAWVIAATLLLLRAERRIYQWHGGQTLTQQLMAMLDIRRLLTVLGINVLIDVAMFHGMLRWLMVDRLTVVGGRATPSDSAG